jgi:hypothetical protein
MNSDTIAQIDYSLVRATILNKDGVPLKLLVFDTEMLEEEADSFGVSFDGEEYLQEVILHQYTFTKNTSSTVNNFGFDDSDKHLYFFFPPGQDGEEHELIVNDEKFIAKWDAENEEFIVNGIVSNIALKEKIAEATGIKTGASIGTDAGQYPQSAADALASAIADAQVVADNKGATRAEINNAIEILQDAIDTFANARIGEDEPEPSGEGWDGTTIDVSWYNTTDTEFTISTPEELMGLAAIVNGLYNEGITVIGDDDPENPKIRVFTDEGAHTGSENKATDVYHYGADDFAGKTIYLDANLDMGGSANYMPIGGAYLMTPNAPATKISSSFNGTFDGQGHWIKNIRAARRCTNGNFGDGSHIGLFGRLGNHDGDEPAEASPTVRNVAVTGLIEGNRSVGGIVGKFGVVSNGNKITVENCANYARIIGTDAKGTGGIVGAAWNGGVVQNCFNAGKVEGGWPAGGIVGSNESTVLNSFNVGAIKSGSGESYAMSVGTNAANVPFAVYDPEDEKLGYPGPARAVWNVWYLDGAAPGGGYFDRGDVSNAGAKAQADLQSADFIGILNSGNFDDPDPAVWIADKTGEESINGGFPILYWMGENDGRDTGDSDIDPTDPGEGPTYTVVGTSDGEGETTATWTGQDTAVSWTIDAPYSRFQDKLYFKPNDGSVLTEVPPEYYTAAAASGGAQTLIAVDPAWIADVQKFGNGWHTLVAAYNNPDPEGPSTVNLSLYVDLEGNLNGEDPGGEDPGNPGTDDPGIVTGDKAVLSAAVKVAQDLTESLYSEKTWALLQIDIVAAQGVLADADAAPAQIGQALNALKASIKALDEIADTGTSTGPVTKSLLGSAIAQVATLTEASYTADSWQKMQSALKTAQNVWSDTTATQAQVNAAITALTSSITALTLKTELPELVTPTLPKAAAVKANTAALSNAIENAKAKAEADYTAETYGALQTALRQAQVVLNDSAATQTDIDTVRKTLEEATKNLTVKSVTAASDGGKSESTVVVQEEDTPKAGLGAQADAAAGAGAGKVGGILGWIIAVCLLCAALAYIIVRKRKENDEISRLFDPEKEPTDRSA